MVAQTNYFAPADLNAAGIADATWLRYAVGDTAGTHPRFDAAALAASGEIDEYLMRRGVKPPLAVPLEPIFRENGIALLMDYMTRWADRRPQAMADNAALAREFFEKVATGRIDVDDVNAPTSATQIIHQNPFTSGLMNPVFDMTNANADINWVMPTLRGYGFGYPPFNSNQ